MKAFGRIARYTAALATASAVLIGASGLVAHADNAVADGDGVAPVADNDAALGAISCGVPNTVQIPIAISRNGAATGTNTFKNGAVVTISVLNSTGTGVSASVPVSNQITLPANWTSLSNNTMSSSITATLTVNSAVAGVGAGSITFRATGLNTANATITRDDGMAVTWTTGTCAPSDSTSPVITPSVTGTLGQNGWYTSDVNVSWVVTDSESPATASGCGPSSVSSDTAGVTFTCSATSAGGTSSQSVTVKRDATKPTILSSVAPVRPGSGWWNEVSGGPTASFTCSDAMSGVAACEADHLFGQGENQSKTGSVTDQAGNSATTDVTDIDVDLTDPTADANLTGPTGDDGWFTGDINVDWTVSDDLSGPVATSCPDTTLNADTASADVTCTPTDVAGNTGTAVAKAYKKDATKPTISTAVSPNRPASGWWNIASGAPTVTYTCGDATSGIKSCSTPHTFDEGENLTDTGTAVDNASNTHTATVNDIDVDLTAPAISYTIDGTLGDNNWYTTNVTINWTVTDTGSGVATNCTKETLTTDTTSHTFTCNTKDIAGNPNTKSITIKRDATAPTVLPVIEDPDGSHGWYVSDVDLSWDVADGASGVASTDGCGNETVDYDTTRVDFTCTATDAAGNSSTPKTVDIKRDATKPVVGTPSIEGVRGSNDWYVSEISVDWNGSSDSTSDIGTSSAGCHATQTTDTAGVTFTCTVTDNAGNFESDSVTVKRDATKPTILSSVAPARPGSGWWNEVSGAPTASFNCADNLSGVAACEADHLFGQGENQSKTGTVTDQAGNSATTDVTDIDVDLTDPTADANLTGPTGDDGWFTGNINVDWTVSDGLSGPVATSCPDTTLNADTASAEVTCTPTDVAGNTGTAVAKAYKRDATKPTITAAVSPNRPASDWWNINSGAPTVTYTCGDATSEIKSCSTPHTFDEGENLTDTGTAVDNAGNTDTATVDDINVDLTAPAISYTIDGTLGDNDWYTTNVTIHWTVTDTGSGVATNCANETLSTDSASHTFTCNTKDNAGNPNTKSITIKQDTTAPVITWSGTINDGDSYYFGTVPAASTCSATDNLAGVVGGCGVGGYGTIVGSHTLVASAKDAAGNTATDTRSYSVLSWTARGFYRPVDMGNVWNTVKGGSTVPLKFEAFAGPTELTDVTTTVKSYNVATIACTSLGTVVEDPVETLAATGGTTMRYDWVDGQFIQNWQTPKKPGFCYQATVKLQDGSRIDAFFKLK